MAKVVPNMKALESTSKVLPLKEPKELSEVGQSSCSNSPDNELTQPTLISAWLETDVPTLECDMLDKVGLSGCTELDPKDKQETRKI